MRHRHHAVVVRQAHRNTDHGRCQKTYQQTATHVLHREQTCDEQTDHRQQRRTRSDVAERYERRVIVDNNTRILQTDKGDEESDTRTDCILHRVGDSVHDRLTQVSERKHNKDQTLDKYRR